MRPDAFRGRILSSTDVNFKNTQGVDSTPSTPSPAPLPRRTPIAPQIHDTRFATSTHAAIMNLRASQSPIIGILHTQYFRDLSKPAVPGILPAASVSPFMPPSRELQPKSNDNHAKDFLQTPSPGQGPGTRRQLRTMLKAA